MNGRDTRSRGIRNFLKKGRSLLAHLWVMTATRTFRATGAASRREQELRKLLQHKLAELNANALEANGEIPAERLASLERISKALHLADDLKPPPKRWPSALALLLALALVSVLLLLRVPETGITLEVSVSEVGFVLAAEKPLIGRASVSQLGVSGLRAVHISPDLIQELSAAQQDKQINALRVTAAQSNGISAGAINIAAFIPPAGSRAWLGYMGLPRTYRLALKAPPNGPNITLHADAQGAIEIAAPGVLQKARQCDFNKSGAIFEFESGPEIIDVDLVLSKAAGSPFYTQVPIESLSLLRVEEFNTSRKTLVEPMSTVLGGTLYLESLNAEKHELRPGEHLQFLSARGRIESLELLDDHVTFKFRGRVKGMTVGQDELTRNLMPTLLKWLKENQPLSLLWASTLFTYTLIITVLRWHRR
jgi:hypothetical protein